MLSTPPRMTTSPASQRTSFPNRFSKSSGMVITPALRRGTITKPVMPQKSMAAAVRIPGVAPESPFSKPAWAVYITVTMPTSVAAREATPRLTSISRPATAKSSTLRM